MFQIFQQLPPLNQFIGISISCGDIIFFFSLFIQSSFVKKLLQKKKKKKKTSKKIFHLFRLASVMLIVRSHFIIFRAIVLNIFVSIFSFEWQHRFHFSIIFKSDSSVETWRKLYRLANCVIDLMLASSYTLIAGKNDFD